MAVEAASDHANGGAHVATNAEKYLSFFLGKEEFGVGILHVREIIGLMEITPLPHLPEHVRGVINLRGRIIPVIELRRRFRLNSIDYTDETCIIVVELDGGTDSDPRCVGVIVDNVCEVVDVREDQVDSPPNFGTGTNTDYILGIAKLKERVITLIDVEKTFGVAEIDIGTDARGANGAAQATAALSGTATPSADADDEDD